MRSSDERDPPEGGEAHDLQDRSHGTESASRRGLLKAGVGVLGCGLAAIPVVPALGYVLYPLGGARAAGAFLPVGERGQFSATPVRVDLHADRVDAWSRERDVKLGSCWVVEQDGKLQAFSTACPHLGCAVDYEPGEGKFKCPCHRSAFTAKGEVEAGPSPRPLDTLEIEEKDGLVAIRFERFRQGVPNKEPV
jgi:menaquinol-cytochrome c reductase iron-sulfur subunit